MDYAPGFHPWLKHKWQNGAMSIVLVKPQK